MRENFVGQANVEDTPELKAYYKDLEKYEAGALWTVANKIEPWQPQSASVPVRWRYKDLREHVLRSVELVSPERVVFSGEATQEAAIIRLRDQQAIQPKLFHFGSHFFDAAQQGF